MKLLNGIPLRSAPPYVSHRLIVGFFLAALLMALFESGLLEMAAAAAGVGELLCLKFAARHARLAND